MTSSSCAGPSCDFSMLSELKACLNLYNIRTWFSHPLNSNEKIHILFDVCHMLNVVGKKIADCAFLIDGEQNKIYWEYILDVHKLKHLKDRGFATN